MGRRFSGSAVQSERGVRARGRTASTAAAAVALVVVASALVAVPRPAEALPTIERVAGGDRFATAAALSARTFPPGIDTAFVAVGSAFPDALAGGAAAAHGRGPLLMVTPGGVPDQTAWELARLGPRRIIVFGGASAVSDRVVEALRRFTTSGTVDRVWGADRYVTASAVAAASFDAGVPAAYVATGESFPDALAGAAAAGAVGGPVLLVTRTRVPPAAESALRRLRPGRILLLGGANATSTEVEASLATIAPVTRLAGADRYGTAAAVVDDAGARADGLYLVSGLTFPDALAAGAVAGPEHRPLLLSRPTCLPPATDATARDVAASTITLVGGTAALGPEVERLESCEPRPPDTTSSSSSSTSTSTSTTTSTTTTSTTTSTTTIPTTIPAGGGGGGGGGSTGATEVTHKLQGNLAGADVTATAGNVTYRFRPFGSKSWLLTIDTADVTSPVAPVIVDFDAAGALVAPAQAIAPAAAGQTRVDLSGLTARSGPASVTATVATIPSPPTPQSTSAAVSSGDAPDPSVVRVGNTYWAYSTQVRFVVTPVLKSTDLHTWTSVGDAMPTLPSWAQWGYNWAPTVFRRGDGFVLYFAAREAASGLQCIGNAVASSPAGPFVSSGDQPMLCQRDAGGSIDPEPFLDKDGTPYLVWKSDDNAIGNPARLWSARLAADGLTLATAPVALTVANQAWEQGIIENPSMVVGPTGYHLLYSANDWESANYAIGEAVCSSPSGPCTKPHTGPVISSGPGRTGPGGASYFRDTWGRGWLAYHAWSGATSYSGGGYRSLRVQRIDFGATGPALVSSG